MTPVEIIWAALTAQGHDLEETQADDGGGYAVHTVTVKDSNQQFSISIDTTYLEED